MSHPSPRIGLIGAGAWGKNLARVLHRLGVLAGVAEAAEPLRAGLQAAHPQLPVFASHQQLLAELDLDAVAVASPVNTHCQIGLEVIASGRDLFVEKPMTLTVEEARRLADAAIAADRLLMVGHLLLYKPAVEFLQGWLAGGELGRVFTIHQQRAKLGRARSAENALESLGVHDVAAVLHLLGESPVRVEFAGHCGLRSGIEDDTHLHLTFPSGVQAHLHNSWLWPEDARRMVVVGERGMVIYDEHAEAVRLVRKVIDPETLASSSEGEELLFQAPRDFDALEAELRHFAECVTTRRSPRSGIENGLAVMGVLEEARHVAASRPPLPDPSPAFRP